MEELYNQLVTLHADWATKCPSPEDYVFYADMIRVCGEWSADLAAELRERVER